MPCANAQAARARSGSPPTASIRRARGARPRRRREQVAVELALGHQPVEVRMRPGERAVGRASAPSGSPRPRAPARTRPPELLEAGGDERGLECLLVRQVLVDRGRLDAEPVGQSPHREPVGAFLLEELARGGDDLACARTEALSALEAIAGAQPVADRPVEGDVECPGERADQEADAGRRPKAASANSDERPPEAVHRRCRPRRRADGAGLLRARCLRRRRSARSGREAERRDLPVARCRASKISKTAAAMSSSGEQRRRQADERWERGGGGGCGGWSSGILSLANGVSRV